MLADKITVLALCQLAISAFRALWHGGVAPVIWAASLRLHVPRKGRPHTSAIAEAHERAPQGAI